MTYFSERTEYAYAVGRIRSLERALLDRSTLLRLLDEPLPGVCRLLEERGYPPVGEVCGGMPQDRDDSFISPQFADFKDRCLADTFAELERLQVLELIPPPKLSSALAQAGVAPGCQPDFEQLLRAGRAVGADILLTGTVNNYLMLSPRTSAISITLYAINVHDGKTVWSDNLTRSFENTNIVDEGARLACTLLVQRMVEGMEHQKRAMRQTGPTPTASPTPFAPPTPFVPPATLAALPTATPPAPTTPSIDEILQGLNNPPTPTAVPTTPPLPTLLAPVTPIPTPTVLAALPTTAPVITPVATPTPTPTPTPTKPVATAMASNPRDAVVVATIHFAQGSSVLDDQARHGLDGVTADLGRTPLAPVVVEGHTDDSGTPSYNSFLAHARANAVKEYLRSRGVTANRIITFGFGERSPVADNGTEAGKARNRRAVVRVHPDVDRVAVNGTHAPTSTPRQVEPTTTPTRPRRSAQEARAISTSCGRPRPTACRIARRPNSRNSRRIGSAPAMPSA